MAVTLSGKFYITERDMNQNDQNPDLIADSIKASLFTNTITPNFDTDTAYAVTPYNANEVGTATALTSPAFSVIATNKLKYTSSAVAFPSATFSGAVCSLFWDDTLVTPTADPVLFLIWFGGTAYSVTSGVLTMTPAANGWWNHQLS